MMNFADLESRLRAARIDVQGELARFRAEAPRASADRFLGYLHERGVIGTHLFKELHTAEAVDTVSTVMKPSERLAGTAGPTTSPATGELIDLQMPDYEVLGELGKGAMGEVHLARDVVLHRKVALKSILPHMQQHAALYSRFLAEMQITAQLDHPSIVPVYGVDNGPNGQLAYAMKLVQGQELETVLAETREKLAAGKPLDGAHSLEARLESFLKVCDAIAYAHERGVVHRDIKPANVMIGRFNEVYVMDWGIAKLLGQGAATSEAALEVYDSRGDDLRQAVRTRIGSTIGTPIYMSPEQAAGKVDELDGRSDQYALGLMLQEIVTLKPAVAGKTLDEVLTNAKTASRVPAEAPTGGAEVPRELRAIIDKATRLSPSERYPDVTALANDVRRYLRNEAVLAQPDSATQRVGRWISKHRMLTAVMLVLALALGVMAAVAIQLINQARLSAKHNREVGLVELTASSGLRAQGLDARLQRYERQLSRLSGAVGLATPAATESAFYTSDDFALGPSAPPGLTASTFYGMPVSLDWPVGAIASGSSPGPPSATRPSTPFAMRVARSWWRAWGKPRGS